MHWMYALCTTGSIVFVLVVLSAVATSAALFAERVEETWGVPEFPVFCVIMLGFIVLVVGVGSLLEGPDFWKNNGVFEETCGQYVRTDAGGGDE